jgi:hypothetical protein
VTGFTRFTKQWASTGATLDPSDAQANAGFAFLGATPPSVELFNAIIQDLDDKDNTLYGWIAAVLTAAGITPAEASPSQLLTALKGRLIATRYFGSVGSATYTPTAGTVLVEVELVGGGGAGGGAAPTGAGQCSAGAGGGGGGISRRRILSGFTGITVTVGAGGTPVSGGAGGNGGSTSFGGLLSATGGSGGSLGPAASNATLNMVGQGVGGMGSGGDLNGSGFHGGPAFYAVSPVSGKGGGSPYGDGGIYANGTSAGNSAASFGAGGSGGCLQAGSATAASGGSGGGGLAIVREYA